MAETMTIGEHTDVPITMPPLPVIAGFQQVVGKAAHEKDDMSMLYCYGAAIGMCIPKGRFSMPVYRPTSSPVEYGYKAVGRLIKQGKLHPNHIVKAGDELMALMWKELPDWTEVAEKSDFSQPPQEE